MLEPRRKYNIVISIFLIFFIDTKNDHTEIEKNVINNLGTYISK